MSESVRWNVHLLRCCSMRTLKYFRPALRSHVPPTVRAAYLRFYSAAQDETVPRIRIRGYEKPEIWQHKGRYPRIKKEDAAIDFNTFKERYRSLGRGDSKPQDEVVVRGMSAHNSAVDLAYAVKEEYGHFGLQDQSWYSSTCSKTIDGCRTPIGCNACLTTPK